ncbi:MAG: rane protein of unknown function [Blastococcus sp.]|nr:rane protein of unknown function [Blastococcus sp.]
MTVRARLESHLGSRQVARVVYGAIIGLTLIVAVEDHPPSAAVMAAWLVLTGVTVALAEVYSEVIGVETSERHRVTRHQLAHLLGQGWAVLLGVAFPAVFFLLAVVGVLELHAAFASARWSGLGLIGFYGYWAARFAGAPVPRALAQAAAVATIGALVIAFKVLLH